MEAHKSLHYDSAKAEMGFFVQVNVAMKRSTSQHWIPRERLGYALKMKIQEDILTRSRKFGLKHS